jgi:transposase
MRRHVKALRGPRRYDLSMTDRIPYRRHSPEFKLQVCQEIRSGAIGRRDAQKKYALSDNLIQLWLAKFDAEPASSARMVDESLLIASETRVAALERKVGQLTMELDRLRGPVRRNEAVGGTAGRTPAVKCGRGQP